ncbi:hypothetical protein ID866_5184 [Astraeus odoratus]|nr:hypothetical protein ID866_5184 [Astraeus odoratus]
MSSPTEINLPPNLPYPIRIASLDVKPSTSVQRGTRLLSYSFKYQPPIPGSRPELRFGTWDCALEGTVDAWRIRVGEEITLQVAKRKPVITIVEPCKHGVQVGGLCGLCGKDMTVYVRCVHSRVGYSHLCSYDYTGFSDASRASIQMTHSAFGPTVSLEEAQRIEKETAERLLKSRKLSLIVDLDQTIVHATVDPTVGDWVAEGEAWEARNKKASSTPKETDSSTDSDDTDSDEDECPPNWEALKDVRMFKLGPEAFAPLYKGPQRPKGKQRQIENQGCMYYIKPRPGWQDFLHQLSDKYEMHVYTMGTRAYAEQVCRAIDGDGKVFGGRILSRDESETLEAQVEERPLAKKQEELQIASNQSGNSSSGNAPTDARSPTAPQDSTKSGPPRKALLKKDDAELKRLLEKVHQQFYTLYAKEMQHGRRTSSVDIPKPYDVKQIIPRMRYQTLEGVHILFSSVIPLDTPPDTTEIWRIAHMFGAQCYTELSGRITHVVAAKVGDKHGTAKVDAARKRGGMKIVWLSWFTDSVALWKRQDESPYLLDDPTSSTASLSPNLDPHQISSDPEPDADDWDVEPAVVENPTLELDNIDWNDINEEVEAAMNESDDDDDAESERGSMKSGMVTDDEDVMTDDSRSYTSVNSTLPPSRKRPRSRTPSESGNAATEQDLLRSPLSKRKRLAASRTGMSKLKEAFTAEEISVASRLRSRSSSLRRPTPSSGVPSPVDDDDEEEEDDFLARELGEEWG